MAKLSDVQYAQNGEAQNLSDRFEKNISGLVPYDGVTQTEEKEWYIFKLVESNRSGGVYIPNVDDVRNPKTKRIERIRLLSGIDTIWQSEQKELTPEYIRKNSRNIEFPRGVKIRRVRKDDATLLEFLRVCNSNIGNKNRVASSRFEFYEYDSAAAEKEQYDREFFEIEMATLAQTEKLEPMKKHAAFLGIRLINDIGEPKSESGIRRDYVMYAKRNPLYFKQTLKSDQIEISWLVRKAIADALIDISREAGKVFWAKGGGFIAAMPPTENAQEYLTDLAMTNTKEGTEFKEQLKKVAI